MTTAGLVAIDLFAGAGGATLGLRRAGFNVALAVEIDEVASATYRLNHVSTTLLTRDIRDIDPSQIAAELGIPLGSVALLQACPPCQEWSTLGRHTADDARNRLIDEVGFWLTALLPQAFILENVPGLQYERRFVSFVRKARRLGYGVRLYKVDAAEFGVPQRRKRLIAIGIRKADARKFPRELARTIPKPFRTRPRSAAAAISRATGRSADLLQSPRPLTAKTLARISALPPNGTRFDLPADLVLDCHQRLGHRSAAGPYGRIRTRGPAPTLTTRCTTPSCGSFVHPVADRPITLREAALLQTFPVNYRFAGRYGQVERQIGNAIPVRMAEGIARALRLIATQQGSPLG